LSILFLDFFVLEILSSFDLKNPPPQFEAFAHSFLLNLSNGNFFYD